MTAEQENKKPRKAGKIIVWIVASLSAGMANTFPSLSFACFASLRDSSSFPAQAQSTKNQVPPAFFLLGFSDPAADTTAAYIKS
ncbi:MAG TPA: hypothetical protein PLD40_07210 [Kiritimatiellia bacterium]|jgi:hypothetical protein|nr:hypothetical protein [Kiritimatiellia bacterium]MBP9573112.1 hypothetical protein [Kiritimatiellia bacterium]HOD99936.1 hypothetical protein [Kiritimatiellia bacterium]HOE37164.1 hypothetical protein [Kiritimatiellia bacterium]HOR74576.1 hypothetical protein [Kiritimatiellia bacterium]